MNEFIIWSAKKNNVYQNMLPPSTYEIEYEDMDKGSYRSQVSGNLIDTVVSIKWSKLLFNYVNLTAEQVYNLFNIIDQNPIFIKAKNPRYNTEQEMQMRCSRVKVVMNEKRNYDMSFNLVQKTKVAGKQ